MKNTFKQTLGFTGEILFFVFTGYYLAKGSYWQSIVCLIVAMVTAGYVGRLIKEQAKEEME